MIPQKDIEALLKLIYDMRHSPFEEKAEYWDELNKHFDSLIGDKPLSRGQLYGYLCDHFYPAYAKRRREQERLG